MNRRIVPVNPSSPNLHNHSTLAEVRDRLRESEQRYRSLVEQLPDIDLILSDVVMPHLSGPELIRKLKAGKHDFKTLYMTGFTQEAIIHRGDREHMHPLILKPYTREGLAAKVRQVLDA